MWDSESGLGLNNGSFLNLFQKVGVWLLLSVVEPVLAQLCSGFRFPLNPLLCSIAVLWLFEPAHYKTYNKTSKCSDQPVQPSSIARISIYPSVDSLESVEGTCDKRRLWSDQTAGMRWLTWVFAGRTSLIVWFVVRLLICILLWCFTLS